jgi:hypothetical protein
MGDSVKETRNELAAAIAVERKLQVWRPVRNLNSWNDASVNPAKTFVSDGSYQITYT